MFFVLTQQAFAESPREYSFFAKIHDLGQDLSVVRISEDGTITSRLGAKKWMQDIKGSVAHSSAAVHGQMQLRPLFIVESISPVSLIKLGKSQKIDFNNIAALKDHSL